jgi:hypothetical protein
MILLLPLQFVCHFFFFLIGLAKIFSNMLTRNGDNKHPFLVPEHKEKAFNYSAIHHGI